MPQIAAALVAAEPLFRASSHLPKTLVRGRGSRIVSPSSPWPLRKSHLAQTLFRGRGSRIVSPSSPRPLRKRGADHQDSATCSRMDARTASPSVSTASFLPRARLTHRLTCIATAAAEEGRRQRSPYRASFGDPRPHLREVDYGVQEFSAEQSRRTMSTATLAEATVARGSTIFHQ